MRRDITRVRPLRRARPALNVVRSSPGMPTSTTRAPGRAARIARSTAESVAADLERDVHPEPAGLAQPGGWIPHLVGAQPLGRGPPVRQEVCGYDAAAPAARAAWISISPIGPQPMTAHRPADAQVPEIQRVDGHAERLQQRAVHIGHRVGQRDQQRGRPDQVLAQPAVAGRVAGERDLRAKIGMPVPAKLARLAGDVGVHRDPLAVPRPTLDDARELVPQDQRSVADPRVADPAVLEPVQVRPAQAHRRHPHQHLIRTRLGTRLLAQADVARSMQPGDSDRVGSPAIGRLTSVGCWSGRHDDATRPDAAPAGLGRRSESGRRDVEKACVKALGASRWYEVVPAQPVAQARIRSVVTSISTILDAGHRREVGEVLGGHGEAEAGVVRSAGVGPRGGIGLEVGAGPPDGPGDGSRGNGWSGSTTSTTVATVRNAGPCRR